MCGNKLVIRTSTYQLFRQNAKKSFQVARLRKAAIKKGVTWFHEFFLSPTQLKEQMA